MTRRRLSSNPVAVSGDNGRDSATKATTYLQRQRRPRPPVIYSMKQRAAHSYCGSLPLLFTTSSLLLLCIGFQQVTASTFDGDEWSVWSTWTPCSRTCDGGITQQFRRCKSPNGCHGVSIRRRMCNMQPCGDRRDYRAEQCTAFDGLEYQGQRRRWEPIEDPEHPCAVTCRAEATDIVAKLAPKLRDGTRCRSGTLHVCVDGTCEPVGCDLKLGSPKRIDNCGVCGGDGSTCNSPIYKWDLIAAGPCTAMCGGGQQSASIVCRNSMTDEIVDQFLCNSALKPTTTHQSCNIHPCTPEWQIGEWTVCSVTCGGGLKIRRVFCAQEKNASKIQVAEKLCRHTKKPITQEPCNTELCSHWHVGMWSACSTTCGSDGVRTRNVLCRDPNNLPSFKCDQTLKPPNSMPCEDDGAPKPPCATHKLRPAATTTSISSPTVSSSSISYPDITLTSAGANVSNSNVEARTVSSPLSTFTFSTYNNYDETTIGLNFSNSKELEFEKSLAELEELEFEGPEELPREHTLPLIQPYPPAMDNILFDQNAVPSEPTFVAETWGSCSRECGEGVRRRQVNCKIFLEFTRTIANLPDKECPGPKPKDIESCFMKPCSSTQDKDSNGMESLSDVHHAALADSDTSSYRKTVGFGLPPGIQMQDMTFSWKVDGYTPCSSSCLGGVQERRIVCVRDYDQRAATLVLCMDKPRPDIPTTRTCNDHACPPRWNVSDFGPCSKPCGGGVMTREVSCIHEVTRGNTVTVPNTQCPQPVPRTEMLCNAIDCPPFWEPGDWVRCSKPCGGGERTRELKCKQIIALGQIVDRAPAEQYCTQSKPSVSRPCNKKPCGSTKDVKHGAGVNEATLIPGSVPNIILSEWKAKLTLALKGQANVFNGMVLKLRCPAKSIDRAKLGWMKDYHYIYPQPYKIDIIPKSGVLKIRNTTFSDSGVYSCLINDRPLSNLTLLVQPYHKKNDSPKLQPRGYGGQTFEDSNRIGQRRSSSHDGTLYADQHPGVSMIPIFDTHENGYESTLINSNHKFYSGSASSSSSRLLPSSVTFTIVCLFFPVELLFWISWPFHNMLHSGDNNNVDPEYHSQLVYYNDDSGDSGNLLEKQLRSMDTFPVDEDNHESVKQLPDDTDMGDYLGWINGNEDTTECDDGTDGQMHSVAYDENILDNNVRRRRRRRRYQYSVNLSRFNNDADDAAAPDRSVQRAVRMCKNRDQININNNTVTNKTSIGWAGRVDRRAKWNIGDWAECSDDECFTWNTSLRKRTVFCQLVNSSREVRDHHCDYEEKPTESEECYNLKCQGVWITQPWSECKARCGVIGFKTRILKCVWAGSESIPAGNACKLLPRPIVQKPCRGPPCDTVDECKDRSHHCPAIRSLNLCHVAQYRVHCCHSCFYYKHPLTRYHTISRRSKNSNVEKPDILL